MDYNDLYEILRKEKYSEALQKLDKNLICEFADYLKELKGQANSDTDIFSGNSFDAKKKLENSVAIFRGLILRRKKKLLQLVFVAAETGIMKRDYENMFDFEKKVFDNLVKAIEEGDKELSGILNGKNGLIDIEKNKMILFNEGVEEFVDMDGKVIGPFGKGEMANLDAKVCDILVGGGKATFIDEN